MWEQVWLGLTRMPTGLWTVALLGAGLWWSIVLLGLGDADGAEGALEGAGEAGLDGILGFVTSWAGLGGAREVPFSLRLTVWTAVGWLLSWMTLWTLRQGGMDGGALPVVGASAVSLVGASLLARPLLRPLAPLFRIHQATTHAELAGRPCRILSQQVDARRGRAEVDDGGAGLVLQVRSHRPLDHARGMQALLVEQDAAAGVWWIEPLKSLLEGDDAPNLCDEARSLSARIEEAAEVAAPSRH
jgi:hypothetical protein